MDQKCGTGIDYLARVYKTFDIAPFFSKLIVAIDEDPSNAVTRINLDHPGINIEYTKGTAGVTYERFFKPRGKKHERQYLIVVFGKDDLDPSIAAHEAVHVVNFLFMDVGQHKDHDNDEIAAYLTGWVVSKIFEVKEELEKQPKPIKKK